MNVIRHDHTMGKPGRRTRLIGGVSIVVLTLALVAPVHAEQINTGRIDNAVSNCANADDVCGLYTRTSGDSLTNSIGGVIDIDNNSARGTAYGLSASLAGAYSTASLFNSGTISTTASGDYGSALGLSANLFGADSIASLSNSGTIATSSEGGTASGLRADLSGDSSATLSNTGVIRVSGTARAHQAYVDGRGTARVTTWAMEWKDYSGVADNQKPFAVAGGILTFGDGSNGARLILTPAADGFEFGKAYQVSEMIHTYSGTGTVNGRIGSAEGALPFLKASLSGTDINDQTIALTVDAQQSDGQGLAVNTVSTLQGMVHRVGTILSAAAAGGGVNSGDGLAGRSSLQIRPYYGYQSRRGPAASSADAVGVAVLGTYETDGGHSFGIHLGLEHNRMDNDRKTVKSSTTSGLLGVHGRYNLTDAAYVRGQVSGVISGNSNDFRASSGAGASAYTTSGGLYGAVFGGYDFKADSRNTLTPELGISALWSHLPGMDVTYANNPALNQSYAAQDYTAVYGNASLRWTGGFDVGSVTVKPTVMGGIRQTFTDGKIKSSLTYQGSRYDSSITDDRTLGVVQAGASLPVASNTDLGLNYYGEYGKDTTNHMGYLNVKARF